MTENIYANAFSIDIERAVLSVLFDGRTKSAPGDFLELLPKPDYFWNREHQLVARTIGMMIARGDRVEALSIHDALRQIRFLDAIAWNREDRIVADAITRNPEDKALAADAKRHASRPEMRFEDGLDISDSLYAGIGVERLFEIGNSNGAASGFRKNCELIADHYLQRQLIRTLAESLDKATGADGRTKLMRTGDMVINQVSQIMGGAAVSATMDEAMACVLRVHDAAQIKGETRNATWGLPSLDRKVPLRAGRLYVLAAAPGCGKTSLLLQGAQETVTSIGEGTVGIISREMDSEDLARVLMARTIHSSTQALLSGWLKPEQRERAEQVRKAWEGTNLAVKGTSGKCTLEDISAWIRQRCLRSRGRLAVVYIDYLQLIDKSHPRQMDHECYSAASRGLKLLASELKIAIVVLSALTREGRKAIRDTRTGELKANPEPRMEDLRGSGSIEGDADAIVFIWTSAVEDTDQMPVHLKVDKNRWGRRGSCDAIFDKGNGQVFRDMVAPTVTEDPADSSRKHHAHPPDPTEDVWGDTRTGATA